MSDERWWPGDEDLARYNAECSRGIVHTPEWDAAMARAQERYNARVDAEMIARGYDRHDLDGGGVLWTRIVPAGWRSFYRISRFLNPRKARP